MIKQILLMGALTFAPLNTEEDTTPPTQEKGDVADETTTDENSFDWKAWLEQWFTPSQVAMIMTWVTYAGTIIGLIAKCYSLAKQKTLTAENVKSLIMKELGDKIDESVANNLTSAIVSINKTVENQNEVLALLTKVMALSQENTPESRIAILELISRLGVIDNKEIEEMKETVNKQVEETKAVETKTNESVDTIIETYKENEDGTSI